MGNIDAKLVTRHVKDLIRYVEILKRSCINDVYELYGSQLSSDEIDDIASEITRECDKNIGYANGFLPTNSYQLANGTDDDWLKKRLNEEATRYKIEVKWCINNILYDVEFKGFVRYQKFDYDINYDRIDKIAVVLDDDE